MVCGDLFIIIIPHPIYLAWVPHLREENVMVAEDSEPAGHDYDSRKQEIHACLGAALNTFSQAYFSPHTPMYHTPSNCNVY